MSPTQNALNTILPILIYGLPILVATVGAYVGGNKVLSDKAHALDTSLKREITAAQMTLPKDKRLEAVMAFYAFVAPQVDALTRSSRIHALLFNLKLLYGDFWDAESKAEKDQKPVAVTELKAYNPHANVQPVVVVRGHPSAMDLHELRASWAGPIVCGDSDSDFQVHYLPPMPVEPPKTVAAPEAAEARAITINPGVATAAPITITSFAPMTVQGPSTTAPIEPPQETVTVTAAS